MKKVLAFFSDCGKMVSACGGRDVRKQSGVWLSLVERYVRDVEVAGSNPVTPTLYLQGFREFRKLIFLLSSNFL